MDILQATREINNNSSMLDPLMAEELWHDTGSEHALHILQKFTVHSGVPITSQEQSEQNTNKRFFYFSHHHLLGHRL